MLVLGCRIPLKASVSETLGSMPKISKLDIVTLDLADSDSTRAFASHVLQTYSENISVLLLCAGAVYGQRLVDQAGNEKTLKVNALSQALLLQCLWSRLTGQNNVNGARVVFVASSLHKKAAQGRNFSPYNSPCTLYTAVQSTKYHHQPLTTCSAPNAGNQ
jgi:NAD(P)-dependent dehydrogenase (short-subunit alcohol dehydrogenase family)